MYEYMSAAAVVYEPGAQSGPLVYTYEPIAQSATQVAFRDKGRNGLPAWERIVYGEYSKKNLNTNPNFKVINPFNFVYNWKPILRNGIRIGYETVKIVLDNAEVPAQPGADDAPKHIPIIIFQPSWRGGTTYYIVDDPNMLLLNDKTQKDLIRNTAIWWNTEGIIAFNQHKISTHHPGVSKSGGSRRRRHTRRRKTRRTRK